MAATLSPTASHLIQLADGHLCSLRPWRRRDSHAEDRWPSAELPQHWLQSDPATEGARATYAITELRSGRLAGRIGLRIEGSAAQLGIYLHPHMYGRGIGTDALRVLGAVAWVWHGIELLRLDVAEDNMRAFRCYKRAGFESVGLADRGVCGVQFIVMERRRPCIQ